MKNKLIFYGVFFLIGIFLISLINSASYSSAKPNYGLFKKYDDSSSYSGWDNSVCQSGQDFVLQIAPFGCTPSVVRSDLLEEQNVPVFCAISATQINPLIKVGAIESMSFSGQYPKEISGVGFHPAQAALGTSINTNYPILENIGYAVIILKKQEVESEMLDFVEGNLTAKIRYDVKNAFGFGDALFYLPELSDAEFLENKKSYSFWKGDFYIRAERVEENFATISIYNDIGKISSVTLEKGTTSNKISVPGFNCLAKLQLRLDNLENPGTTVKLDVNGEIIELVQGQKFLDNNCQITNINKQGIVQRVQVSCYEEGGRKSFTLSIVPRLNISVGGVSNEYSVGDKIGELTISAINLVNKNSKEIKDIQVTLTGNGKTYTLSTTSSVNPGNQEIKLLDFAGLKDVALENEVLKNYNFAFDDYSTLMNSFGSEKCELDTDCDKFSLEKRILLAKELDQMRTVAELCTKYKEKFGKEYSDCENNFLLSSKEPASEFVLINGEMKSISLKGISNSDFEDYGAKVIIDGKTYNLEKDNVVYLNGSSNKEFIQLIDLKDEIASVKFYLQRENSNDYISGTYTLKKNVHERFGSVHDIYLSGINLEKYAKVSVISNIDNVGTSANFSFKIGIEKRAIQLSPDKIQKKIDSLNETITKWEGYEKSLGNMVTTMKGACLATSGFLIAKNFLFNQGDSLARKDVTSVWNQKCTNHMSGAGGKQIAGKEGEIYATLDACLADNSEAIDDAVSKKAEIMKSVSDDFSKLQEGVTTEKWAGLEEVVDDKKLWGEIESSDLLIDLKTNVQACYGENVTIDGKEVSVSELISAKRINENTTAITQLRDMLSEAKFCSSGNGDIAKINLDKSLATMYSNSEEPKKIAEYGSKTGYSSHSTIGASKKIEIVYENKFLDYKDVSGYTLPSGETINPEDNIHFRKDANTNKEYFITYSDDGVVKQTYEINSDKSLTKLSSINPMNVKFEISDASSYKNKFISSQGEIKPKIRFYETSPYKGLPANVPFDLINGWYVSVSQDVGFIGSGSSASYDDSGAVRNYYLCNVGANGKEEDKGGDDKCRMINKGTGQVYSAFNGLDANQAKKLVDCAEQAIVQASRGYGKKQIQISTPGCGGTISLDVGSPAVAVPDMQCQNFMSPSDCQILFNVCDPVICPSSRCDFGGAYPVSDVIQSGIIGGIALCLPNFVGFGGDVYIPFCLSGIHAGIEGLVSIYKSYRDCLQENLNSGKTVGVCDEIHSVYLCEFFWKQALPLAKYSVPKIIEAMLGQNVRGGGEYFTFRNALETASNSVNYFTNYYAANAINAFNLRSVEEAGTEICKNYISGVGPNVGGMIDSFTSPNSPAQFHGWFEEEKYTTATVPATSHYKVFYHIYSGDDSSAYYQVYLKGGLESSYYQDSMTTRLVDSGYITAGEYKSETKDFLTTAGYTQLCIRVNDQEECGFKKVSTSFAVNYVTDEYVGSVATENDINSETECVSGNLANVLTESEIYEFGIIRICAHDNPGVGTDAKAEMNGSRWTQVGWCDESKGIKCWLDGESVKNSIRTASVEGGTLEEVNANYLDILRNTTAVSNAESEIESLDTITDANKIIEIVNENFGKLIMNEHKIKALIKRALAYSELVKRKKIEESKTPEGSESTCQSFCEDKGYSKGENISSQEKVESRKEELEKENSNFKSDYLQDEKCFCWTSGASTSETATTTGVTATGCQKEIGDKIITIAKEIKSEKNIEDLKIIEDTGAECFEQLFLMVAYQESGLQHCKENKKGDCLYCNENKTDLISNSESLGVMQLNKDYFALLDISDFDKNVENGINYLVNSYSTIPKVYTCGDKEIYSGWKKALRYYNGWNTDCDKGNPYYVENVTSQKSKIKDMFPNACN